MTSITRTPRDPVNLIWVGKNGDDSFTNAGVSPDYPFASFGAAVDAASAGDTVVSLDGGEYTISSDLICKDGVNIYAPNATIFLDGGATIRLNDMDAVFWKIYRDTGGGSCVVSQAATGDSTIKVMEVVDGGTGVTFRNTVSTTNLHVYLDRLFINGGGIGIADFTGLGTDQHLHIYAEDIYLNSDGAVGIQKNNGGSIVGFISHIRELGTRTGTVAFDINDGTLDITTNEVLTDTLVDIETGGKLNLQAGEVDGNMSISIGAEVNISAREFNFSRTITNNGLLRGFLEDRQVGVTEAKSTLIQTVADQDYYLMLDIPQDIEITRVITRSISGTCTATVNINGTPLGGTANSVSTAQNIQAHNTANEASAGDDVSVTISSNAACSDMSIVIEYILR